MSLEQVESAITPEVFNLDKFLVDIAYPTEEVKVYTDAKAANEKVKLIEEYRQKEVEASRATAKNSARTIDEPVNPAVTRLIELEEEIAKLTEAIEKSEITLTIRGISPGEVEEITKGNGMTDPDKDYSGTEIEEARDLELISRSIIAMTHGNSVPVTSVTPGDVEKLKGSLLGGEYHKIVVAVANANLNGALFDMATDASFLSGRSDVAGE